MCKWVIHQTMQVTQNDTSAPPPHEPVKVYLKISTSDPQTVIFKNLNLNVSTVYVSDLKRRGLNSLHGPQVKIIKMV